MKMYFNVIIYFFYMIIIRAKGIKYKYIKKYKGKEASDKYVEEIFSKWAKFTINIIGIEIDVIGKNNIPKDESCVFIANHTSILDIPILFNCIGKELGFISKKEVLKTPILGYWLEKAHCIPIDRSNAREAMKSILRGVENLKQGYSMVIFPEGTRSKDGVVGEFRQGSIKLATKAKSKIVPVSIEGAYNAFEKERKFKPAKVRVCFGEVIETKNLTKEEEKELMNSIREKIINQMKQK